MRIDRLASIIVSGNDHVVPDGDEAIALINESYQGMAGVELFFELRQAPIENLRGHPASLRRQ